MGQNHGAESWAHPLEGHPASTEGHAVRRYQEKALRCRNLQTATSVVDHGSVSSALVKYVVKADSPTPACLTSTEVSLLGSPMSGSDFHVSPEV